MKYYRVNREVCDWVTCYDAVFGELLTLSERKKMFPSISDKCFDTVIVKKSQTHRFFGARYPNESALVVVVKQMDCI